MTSRAVVEITVPLLGKDDSVQLPSWRLLPDEWRRFDAAHPRRRKNCIFLLFTNYLIYSIVRCFTDSLVIIGLHDHRNNVCSFDYSFLDEHAQLRYMFVVNLSQHSVHRNAVDWNLQSHSYPTVPLSLRFAITHIALSSIPVQQHFGSFRVRF